MTDSPFISHVFERLLQHLSGARRFRRPELQADIHHKVLRLRLPACPRVCVWHWEEKPPKNARDRKHDTSSSPACHAGGWVVADVRTCCRVRMKSSGRVDLSFAPNPFWTSQRQKRETLFIMCFSFFASPRAHVAFSRGTISHEWPTMRDTVSWKHKVGVAWYYKPIIIPRDE